MFGIGTFEFLVIIVVAVLVLGPEHLPRVIRTVTKVMSDFRRISTDFQRAINLEANKEDYRQQHGAEAFESANRALKTKKKKKKKPAVPDAETGEAVAAKPKKRKRKPAPSAEPEVTGTSVPTPSPAAVQTPDTDMPLLGERSYDAYEAPAPAPAAAMPKPVTLADLPDPVQGGRA